MRELLMLLCNYPLEGDKKELAKIFLRQVRDWKTLLKLINDHGIIALTYYNLENNDFKEILPSDFMQSLRKGFMQNITRNLWLSKQWKEVNNILISAGIRHLLLKGMALEYTRYNSKGLRQMNDNDILISKKDALKAWYLLQDHGFKHDILKSRLHRKILLDIGKHLPALYKDGYTIEIHHKLFYESAYNDSIQEEIENAVCILIDGVQAYILRERTQGDYLVQHLRSHMLNGEFQLRLYSDLLLLGRENSVFIPDEFILHPLRKKGFHFRSQRYRTVFYSLPVESRFRFLIGDIFAYGLWMKKTYNCNAAFLPFFYFVRLLRTVLLFKKPMLKLS